MRRTKEGLGKKRVTTAQVKESDYGEYVCAAKEEKNDTLTIKKPVRRSRSICFPDTAMGPWWFELAPWST